jgi:hypothetical protein
MSGEAEFGAALLRFCIAAGSAALLIVLCALAYLQAKRLSANPGLHSGFVVAAAIFGALMTWAFLDRAVFGGTAAERRALELRAQQLSAQVLLPGSPLACLDSLAGESVAAACEKALFGSPAIVASASAYVAAQLTLFANMTAFAGRDGAGLEPAVMSLRRALETDRFGFVAYVLATRDGCSAQKCKALALFRDANRVRTNLTNATVERYLERYAPGWAAPDVPVAEGTQAPPTTGSAGGQPSHKVVNIDFPSAASIPAVSIMNPEPTLPGAAAAAAANPNGAAGKHRKAPPPPNPNVAASSPPAPPAVEPIWPEPMPAPPAGAPPAAAAPAAASAPVQLTPPAVNASAAAAPRAQ